MMAVEHVKSLLAVPQYVDALKSDAEILVADPEARPSKAGSC
jgi:hypothetical protein